MHSTHSRKYPGEIYSVLTISSDLDTVLQVVNKVVPNLEENGTKHGNDEIDVRMLVHQSQAGCVIGKGGLKIKELREVDSLLHDGTMPECLLGLNFFFLRAILLVALSPLERKELGDLKFRKLIIHYDSVSWSCKHTKQPSHEN
ncbi:hypothetical protein PV326_008469 [Microctonus aethiopoides]|nr:hypothetical protein PV326_008469 [Microctonus aethiopoides]